MTEILLSGRVAIVNGRLPVREAAIGAVESLGLPGRRFFVRMARLVVEYSCARRYRVYFPSSSLNLAISGFLTRTSR
jgi:hypothetical protein